MRSLAAQGSSEASPPVWDHVSESLVCWAGQASLPQVSAGLCPPRGGRGLRALAAFCTAHPACAALSPCSGHVCGTRF